MVFFTIFFALLFEQARPLGAHSSVHKGARAWVLQILRSFDTGQNSAAWLAWSLMVLVPAVLTIAVHWLLLVQDNWPAWLLLFIAHVAVLYFTLGFRQFSMYFSTIRDAMAAGDEATARAALARWTYVVPNKALSGGDVLRRVLAQSALSAHVHVFGVMVSYCLGAALGLGPAGAVIYRMAELVARACAHYTDKARAQPGAAHVVSSAMLNVAQKCWFALDWLPARISALLFAIVGNFEEAIDGWRNYNPSATAPDSSGLILAATAGALNLNLGVTIGGEVGVEGGEGDAATPAEPANPDRDEPKLAHMQAVVGLVWRAVVVWMTLLALFTVARLS